MHPDNAFRFDGDDALRAFVAERAFAHLFAVTAAGPMVAHVPLSPHGDAWRFHIARRNRVAAHLDGAVVIASIMGPDGYVSPDWYADARDQVPTWTYVSVEIEATCHRLDEVALLAQIDTLSLVHEARLAPKPPWTSGKVAEPRLRALLAAIVAFELRPTAMLGTLKLSQNKSSADRAGVVAALGDAPLAKAMRE